MLEYSRKSVYVNQKKASDRLAIHLLELLITDLSSCHEPHG